MFLNARIFSAEKMLEPRAVALTSHFETYTFNYLVCFLRPWNFLCISLSCWLVI